MVYTLKKYKKELKTNQYWGIEPHFYYYCMIKLHGLFRIIIENDMSSKDFQSAMYGEFEIEGKPILKGFISHFNVVSEILDKIIIKISKKEEI